MVEHVTVNEGGQAIVGSAESSLGRETNKDSFFDVPDIRSERQASISVSAVSDKKGGKQSLVALRVNDCIAGLFCHSRTLLQCRDSACREHLYFPAQ